MLCSNISVHAVFHSFPLTFIVHKTKSSGSSLKGSLLACREFSLIAFLEPVLDFDRRVNDNKTAAEEALRRIPAINQTIMEANEKTREAQLALGNAAADATEAKNKAHEAERIASAVQKVCSPLLSETKPLLIYSLVIFQFLSRPRKALANFFLNSSKVILNHPSRSFFFFY